MANIAFIGLGNMGLPMALNLKKAGHNVLCYDLSESAIEKAKSHDLSCADSVEQTVLLADAIVSMLPQGDHVVKLYETILNSIKKKPVLIDCSTIDITSAHKFHELAKSHELASLDAPVSGGVGGAEAGTLTFMVGGEQETFEAHRSILEAMGKNIIHCGQATTGQAAKICNNMILGISMIAVSEAFVLGEQLGLSHEALYDVASKSSGQCWSLTSYCPVPGPVPSAPSNRDYQPGFASELMLKDLKLSQAANATLPTKTPLGAHAASLYEEYVAEVGRGRDFSGIIEWLRERDDN